MAVIGIMTVVFSITVVADMAAARIDIVGPAPIQPSTVQEAVDHNSRDDAVQPPLDDIDRMLSGLNGSGEPRFDA